MPIEQHPTKPDTLVFRGHPAAMTKSATVERARHAAQMLRDRNKTTWDETDREVVFAIDALIASAEWHRMRHTVRSTSNSSQE